MMEIGSILQNRVQKEVPRVNTEWQSRAFQDMQYLGIKLLPNDIGRVFRVYKEQSKGNSHKATTQKVISFLKDYPTVLNYEATLKMFFKLITNGIKPYETNRV